MPTDDNGTTYNQNVAKSQVNEATDTVHGQLQKHTDFKSPVMKRVAQQAKNSATERGLGNTTIAGQAATAAVIDKAGQYATKDAEIYSTRRNANQQAGVQLESNAMANKANIAQTNLTNENRLQVQGKANEGALAQVAAKGDIDKDIATSEQTAKDVISQREVEGQQTRLDAELTSLEARTAADNVTKLEETYAKVLSDESIAFLDNDTKRNIALIQQQTELLRNKNQSVDQAWSSYQTGLATIDANAKAASQKTQAKRLAASFKARMDFLNQTTPTSVSNISNPPAPTGLSDNMYEAMGWTKGADGVWKRS